MGIETGMYNQLLRPPKSVAEYDAEAMQGQQNRLALQMDRAKMDAVQRGIQQEAQLADVYRQSVGADGKTDRNKLYSGAAAAGLGAKLPGMQKGYAELDETAAKTTKEQRLAEKAQYETARDQLNFVNQVISAAKDQVSYSQGRQAMAARGLDVSQIPEQFDPAYVAAAGEQTRTEQQRVEDAWKAKKFDLDERQFGEVKRSNLAAEGDRDATRKQSDRHHNDRESRERGDVGPTGAKGGKAPAGYRWAAAGDLEPIPGGPASNKSASSEGERKAGTLLQRLEFSEKQLEAAVKRKPSAAKPDLIANGLRGMGMEAAANTITGSERQEVDAAQLDLLDAALTLGTGAAYTKQQLEGYQKSYFAQIGDTPANVKAKEARLKNVIDAARTQAGRSAPQKKDLPKVATAADYDKIPSGAEYITPDGQTRRKK